MKKLLAMFICIAIVFSFGACKSNDDAINKTIADTGVTETENKTTVESEFTELENKTIVTNDGTEYTFVGFEGRVQCFGGIEFLEPIAEEKETFNHLGLDIKTGLYSVNGCQDVLVRYLPDNEFYSIYVKSDLLKKEVSLDNCIRFMFVKGFMLNDEEILNTTKGITECKQFLDDIKSGQSAEDAGLYDLVRQPDGMFRNCYGYGYVCGVLQDDLNLVIPLFVTSFDDKAYAITIDDVEYVLPKEWLEKLTTE